MKALVSGALTSVTHNLVLWSVTVSFRRWVDPEVHPYASTSAAARPFVDPTTHHSDRLLQALHALSAWMASDGFPKDGAPCGHRWRAR